MSDSPILQARGITKEWPGVKALDGVDFNVYAGKVHAIIGENGAGKSTLMNILSGAYTTYEGTLLLDGRPVTFRNTADAAAHGISMIHQELNLIPHLSVAENIFLGHEPVHYGMIDYRTMHRAAAALLERLRCRIDTHSPVADLRVGEQQLVEIAKALSYDARVLIMDEPTSSLSEQETQQLFTQIEALTAKGVGIVYITHKMDELTRLADYITVLRDGCRIAEHRAGEVSVDELIHLMVGRARREFFVKEEHPKGAIALRVSGLSMRDAQDRSKEKLHDISLEVAAGEVLGIYGLMGAGRSELLQALFGLHPRLTTGCIEVLGKKVLIHSPADAIGHGLALIPEDRKCDGLVLGMDIRSNITLASLGQMLRYGIVHRPRENRVAEQFRDRLAIKSHSTRQTVGNLSGGNQQKVVLSKWLMTNPKILLLDEPTRGIDIHAKNEIYKLISRLASQGLAVVVVSSELPEIMAISDRLLTLSAGRLSGEFRREGFSEETILRAALPPL
ncbi:MAG: sugar ABC transporter ATP-binding protein [Prevotellaceae bacterium]|jgi:ribose transport system ATP-binding protein|nr:sugar ABC transporter ATP-binding protein [Prevotellaceae bacterium]